MKSIKIADKFKTCAVSIAVCLALIVCAVLSFGFFNNDNRARAEDTGYGVRFVQVAAGQDFAIGLTYDGSLYGWSLNAADSEQVGKIDASTLGEYYSTTPSKIDVIFRNGPKTASSTVDWSNSTYHAPITNDKIKRIAATRYTAAFVTEKGYLYTWGKDTGNCKDAVHSNEADDGDHGHYLLLRLDNDQNAGSTGCQWHTPHIINYDYYNNSNTPSADMPHIIPGSDGFNNVSLAGGEYNYNFVYQKGTGNYYSYVWGSMMYNTPNVETTHTAHVATSAELNAGPSLRHVYQTSYSSGLVTAVAGGYNVGLNVSSTSSSVELPTNSTSLSLRGRNFLTTQAITASGAALTPKATVDVLSGGTNSINYTQDTAYAVTGLVGGGTGWTADGGIIATRTGDGGTTGYYYGRQACTDENIKYNGDSYTNINYAADGVIDGSATNSSYTQALRFGVSIGNDIGYGIAGGVLYAWGDNAKGQSGATGAAFNSKPVTVTVSDSGAFVSVAAGKQLSSANKAFNYRSTLSSATAFNAVVKNYDDYITGAVTDSGKLYVWSNNKATPQQIKFGNRDNDGSKFVAVYSGYGNNLFAVNKLGKVVLITYADGAYKTNIYDTFKNSVSASSPVSNWTIAGKTDNVVRFTVDSSTVKEPTLGNVTLYVDYVNASQNSIKLNNVGADAAGVAKLLYGASAGERTSIVRTNAIGDSYRILDYNNDSGITYLTAPASAKTLTKEQLTPVFKLNGVVMTPKQRENMFDYSIVYDSEHLGVGINIAPKQSSKGGTVSVEFYVARFDDINNFDVTENKVIQAGASNVSRPVTDNANYYDYKQCAVNFVIDNTPAYMQFNAFRENGNSNIPLLDPNNAYNKNYSIAVQNVSQGVSELVKYLRAQDETTSTQYGNFVKAITDAMISADDGYPAQSKIESGKLDYYLGAAEANRAYSGSYQYFITDRDSDVLSLLDRIGVDEVRNASVSSVTRRAVNVKIKIGISAFGANAAAVSALATDFDNKYGLHDIKVDGNELSFNYDIIMLTAENATGRIAYKSGSVSDYDTSKNADSSYLNLTVTTREYYNASNADTELKDRYTEIPWDSAAAVFAQPTLRLKDADVYGRAADGKNKYSVDYTANHTVKVGGTYEINLEDYINKIGEDTVTSQIRFTYGSTATKCNLASYDKFNALFADDTGSGIQPVELSAKKIVIKPTSTHPINFTVTVQRSYGGSNYNAFGADEKIEISFKFATIGGFTFRAINPTTPYTVARTGVIDILEPASGVTVNTTKLVDTDIDKSAVKMSQLKTTNSDVLDITKLTDTSFRVTPKTSGTAVVLFVVSAYGKSDIVTLSFNVSGLTKIKEAISLTDIRYVFVNNLLTTLKTANKHDSSLSNYGILKDDLDNAVYFTKENGDAVDTVTGYPDFIESVGFLDDNTRIKIQANSASIDTARYYMRVRFADTTASTTYAEAGTVLETQQMIASSKVIVRDAEGNSVSIEIDCDAQKPAGSDIKTDWYTEGTGKDFLAYIPVYYLMTLGEGAGIANPDEYEIRLVSSTTDAVDYFNYTFDTAKQNVLIAPLYNTTESISVNVSVGPLPGVEGVSKVLAFNVSVKGISTTLDKSDYTMIWLVAFFSSLGLLIIIFLIRMIVYWRRRAKQRALIKRNQELIKLRDRVHNKSTGATREQIVKTKLKMEDPKYAKMLSDMRKSKQEAEGGVTLENADFTASAEPKGKSKKKKGGKKSLAELKAELEAKKMAFAQAQNVEPINPFVSEVPVDGQDFGSPTDAFAAQDLDGSAIIFDAPDMDDGVQG